MSAEKKLINKAKYKVAIDLPLVLPFYKKMHSILLREYGLANERVPTEGSAHHKKDGISFSCRPDGAGMDNPGICTIIGPLSKKEKIDRYVLEATEACSGDITLDKSAYSKIEL